MSVGHRRSGQADAAEVRAAEALLRRHDRPLWQNWRARLVGTGFNWAGIPENYSPTSFLINTLLPPDNNNRTMDYVATIFIE